MNGSAKQGSDDRERLKQAIVDHQAALLSTVSSLITPPIRPVRMVLDKKGMEASLQPLSAASEEVARRFASIAGVDEQTAKSKVRPLLKEVGVLANLSWDSTTDVEAVKQPVDSGAQELARRSERLNAAAVDALIRFYLEGGHPPHDELFAETRRAWQAYEPQRRVPFRKRRRVAASERHRQAWQRWGAFQQV